MSKLFIVLLSLAVLQIAYSFPSEDSEQANQGDEDWSADEGWTEDEDWAGGDLWTDDDSEERAFWDGAISQGISLLKKAFDFRPLTCNGASCSSCIRVKVINKEGCFTVNYNKQTGANARLEVSLNAGGKQLFKGGVNAGKSVPACANIPGPVKQVCLQDFWVNVPNGHDGDICFTINFKTYSSGVKFCANFRNGSLVPSVHPQIIKT